MEIDSKKYPLPKRLRHHTTPNLYIPWEDLKKKPDYYPPLLKDLDVREVFKNGKYPDALDVGCGKGKLLFDHSEMYPDKNILGIEVRLIAVEWIDTIIKGEDLPNVAAIWYSVVNGLPFIESGSLEKVLYLFPDPWYKSKHQKRRAFNHSTVKEFYRVLKSGGELCVATDVPEVDEHHREILQDFGKFECSYLDKNENWRLPITNKEKFCKKENIDYVKMICKKI